MDEVAAYLGFLACVLKNNFFCLSNISGPRVLKQVSDTLNLATNHITGNIPPCFGSFSAVLTSNNIDVHPAIRPEDNFGTQDVNVKGLLYDTKGDELKYASTLWFLFSIDLSDNNISGEIPEELMALHGLSNLNLAGNHLSGRIPDTIGKLKKLEFLDLSRNELYKNFLSRLNLYFNDLSGRIPTGNQLQTLDDPSIYVGNNQLCGRPILKPCDTESLNNHGYNEAESHSDSDDEWTWFYAGIGPGVLVGFVYLWASLHFANLEEFLLLLCRTSLRQDSGCHRFVTEEVPTHEFLAISFLSTQTKKLSRKCHF